MWYFFGGPVCTWPDTWQMCLAVRLPTATREMTQRSSSWEGTKTGLKRVAEIEPKHSVALSYPGSSFHRSDLTSENIVLPVEACPTFKRMTDELLGNLLLVICTVFKTNQQRSCKGTFESHKFSQACVARNEDSMYEID